MPDPIPVSLDPWQRIVEVGWGGAPIALLIVDLPDSVTTTVRLDPSASFMNGNDVGDVIERTDLASFNDSEGTHQASASYLVFNSAEPLILSSLYGAGSKKYWEIDTQRIQPGPDPGDPRGTVFGPSPHDLWTRYKETDFLNYDSVKAGYEAAGSGFRFIEINDLRSLDKNTILSQFGGIGPFRVGETWLNFDYGFWGCTSHWVVGGEHAVTGDPDVPMYFGFQQFDQFLPALVVGWGLAESQHSTGRGSNLVRHVYFIDFKALGTVDDGTGVATTGDVLTGGLEIANLADTNILVSDRSYAISGDGIVSGTRFSWDGETGGTLDKAAKVAINAALLISQDGVAISNNSPIFDTELGEFDMTLDLAIYPGGTKFTVTEDSVIADLAPIVASVKKTISYYQDGELFKFDKKGWII